MSPGTLIASLSQVIPINPLSITGVGLYTDKKCTISLIEFFPNSECYFKISASDDNVDNKTLIFNLTSDNIFVTTNELDNGRFEVFVGNTTASSISFTASVVSGPNSANVVTAVSAGTVPIITISNVGIYSDLECSHAVTSFNNNTIYYVQISAYGTDSASFYSYTLTSNNINVAVTDLGNGLFMLSVGGIPSAPTVQIMSTVSYENNSTSENTTIEINT